MTRPKWDRCASARGVEAEQFLSEYFLDVGKVLFVAGAGFDPRSTNVLRQIPDAARHRIQAWLLREERPRPDSNLVALADKNEADMRALVNDCAEVCRINTFAHDNAVVGGSSAVKALRRVDLTPYSDIVVDFSALSVGVAFPLLRFVLERVSRGLVSASVHVVVTDSAQTDIRIRREAHDRAQYVHGFRGQGGLLDTQDKAKLWMPQLVEKRRTELRRIHEMVVPDDVCPVLPFPSANPRRSDDLLAYYVDELVSAWSVSPQSLVYASEKNPLDLYRTILRIDDLRRRVFDGIGGAQTILSPMGSKALSVGAFMAAVERDFPVAYIEAASYRLEAMGTGYGAIGDTVHVWLHNAKAGSTNGDRH